MSESIEHALEHAVAGVLFCIAVAMLLWLHGTFVRQIKLTGKSPERLIMAEQSEGREWNHSDVP